MSLQTIGRLAVALALFALPGSARASTSASLYASDSGVSLGFEYFEDDLEPYGRWIDTPAYGTCWVPAHAPHGWRPYWDGHWTYTDCGWSWVSNEPWGWATYHYGRWFHDPYHGWMWMPGSVWAPSWVAWHCGDGYVGWAPLPPAAHWNVSIGLRFGGVDRIPSRDWCYVEQRNFTHSKIKYKIVDRSHNDRIHRRTHDTTRFESWNGRPKNVGLEVAQVNDWGGGKVKKFHAVDAGSSRKGRAERVRGNSVEYFRPDVSRAAKFRGEDRQVKRPIESVDRQLTKRSSRPAERELVKSRDTRAPRGGREIAMSREVRERRTPPRRESAQRVEERRTAPSKGKSAQRSENRKEAPSKSKGKSAKPRGK